jgi:nucleotide-binding universal stress UspA family protein
VSRAWKEVRRVLVPVDFSDSARPIVEYACGIAKDRGAAVSLLHVVTTPSSAFDSPKGAVANPKVVAEFRSAAEKELDPLVALVKKAGVPVESKVLLGAPAREIVRFAKESKADLVVVGTHGRSGMRHVFLGSVAENVVRLCPCPVITLRLPGFEIERL